MKRLLAILLVLLMMTMLLAACGPDSEDPGDTDGEPEASQEETETEPEYLTKKVTVTHPDKGEVEMDEVPLLPNGEFPSAN